MILRDFENKKVTIQIEDVTYHSFFEVNIQLVDFHSGANTIGKSYSTLLSI